MMLEQALQCPRAKIASGECSAIEQEILCGNTQFFLKPTVFWQREALFTLGHLLTLSRSFRVAGRVAIYSTNVTSSSGERTSKEFAILIRSTLVRISAGKYCSVSIYW